MNRLEIIVHVSIDIISLKLFAIDNLPSVDVGSSFVHGGVEGMRERSKHSYISQQ